ncbi:MAG TPA: hypothetical protein VGF21_06860 [Thermoleophilaceae bacterium]|jgi:predicted Zn-dependent protease
MARFLLALVAVLALAWTGVLLRDYERGHDPSTRAFNPRLGARERDRELARVKDAQFLDPSSDWQLARAGAYLAGRRPAEARRLAEEIVRGEPENLGAWSVLLQATLGRDPARAREAKARLKRLDPLDFR